MLIQIIKRTRLAVNPADISAMFIYTVNHDRVLQVRMRDGENYRVQHAPHCHDGDDVYQVHKLLLEAQ
ncbi:hypothetical protein [Pseudomonas fragariae (ex Marin et al. 2024)]|uniref:hypothetical protein n=1 Tax=Pseudomonas fragariae (ex Marin et al. 2024) TaxID=3080056 RepID=UPI002A23A103|nr:hypothetical protein [Pseudomonas sp. 20]MDX9624286.1 hypothetical protein [Pseudomonas sp. 20]